jgi:hypothetical protein
MSARRLSALMRHYARLVAFSLPPVRRLLERPTSAPPDLRVALDHAWSDTTQSADLGGTTMDQTAATVANLIRYRLPEYPKVLDVGCAGGTLAGEAVIHVTPEYIQYIRDWDTPLSGIFVTELLIIWSPLTPAMLIPV